jgi:hypothetical protein
VKGPLQKGSRVRSLKVLGRRIRVRYVEIDEWGLCDNDQLMIFISLKCIDDPNQHWLTIIHEVTHMILRMTGLAFMERQEEEAIVRCIENLIIPWIFEYNYLKPK